MSIEDFHDMMPDSVVVHPYVDRDAYGDKNYGDVVPIGNARIVYKSFNFRKPDGKEVTAKGMVWLGTYLVMTVNDKIVLPDSTSPPLLLVESFPDEDGGHHTKIIFG